MVRGCWLLTRGGGLAWLDTLTPLFHPPPPTHTHNPMQAQALQNASALCPPHQRSLLPQLKEGE